MRATITQDAQGRRRAVAPCTSPCAIERGMRVLGGKWTASILWHLKDDPVRFNDLARMIAGASKKMIAERLRHLETHGLVERKVRVTQPVTVTYALTQQGQTALAAVDHLRQWSEATLPDG